MRENRTSRPFQELIMLEQSDNPRVKCYAYYFVRRVHIHSGSIDVRAPLQSKQLPASRLRSTTLRTIAARQSRPPSPGCEQSSVQRVCISGCIRMRSKRLYGSWTHWQLWTAVPVNVREWRELFLNLQNRHQSSDLDVTSFDRKGPRSFLSTCVDKTKTNLVRIVFLKTGRVFGSA